VEQLGDTLTRIANILLKEKKLKSRENVLKDAEKIYLMHKKAAEALFRKDEKLAVMVQREKETFKSALHKPLTFSEAELYADLSRIADYVKDIADVVVAE